MGRGDRRVLDHLEDPALARRQPVRVGWAVGQGTDRAARAQLCLDLGVRAVITDRPAFVLDLLDRATPP